MKKILLAVFLQFFLIGLGRSQCVATCSAYNVSPISYSLFANDGYTLNSFFAPTADDGTVSVPIGFNFDFYCGTYADVIVCTNGFLQFDYGVPLGFGSPAYSHPPQSFPTAATPNGLVALQMNDFDVSAGGSISYTTVGSYPNRQFILTYTNVPIWYDAINNVPPLPLYNSGQIVLNETTNIIEIHTANIPISPYYGTQGIENTTGTLSATPPGRNFAAWSGTNSAYQFSPFTPAPPSIIAGSTLICQGASDFYQAAFNPSITSYNWSFPSGWAGASSSSTFAAFAGSTGALSLTATYTCGTSAPSTLNIYVNPSPTVNISVTPAIICSGKTVTLNTSGALSYTIQPANLTGLPTFTDAPIVSTIYSVSGTNSFGCQSYKNGTVAVQVKPTPTVIVNNGAICLGDFFNINAQSTATSYTVIGVNGNFLSVTPTLTGEYSYTVIGNGGNGCISEPVVSSLTVNALPEVTALASRSAICKNESVIFTAGGASAYLWSNGSTSNSISINPMVNVTYTVTGTNAFGCQNSEVVSVLVSACTGLNEQGKEMALAKIYPNPTHGVVQISLSSGNNFTIEVYNAVGQLLQSQKIQQSFSSIDISGYSAGIYYIKIKNAGHAETVKLIKD
ncbi:hypothetical protein CNR22_08050 [Sphingobacteriaceae bacterium]|nr:hypothetical protein CNR22_08050 [Sphingobacteriaceae bacterium]